ncbi:MAG: hypothetical protein KKD31_09555 [Bacteroidetes bacterium]|nr:hypothetical protein [Bacteroidota bacterium]
MSQSWPDEHKYSYSDKVEVIVGGNSYFEALRDIIDEARDNIYCQFFILDFDDTGRNFINSLMDAASRGVKVFLLLDAYGSGSLPTSIRHEILNSGIELRFFSPYFNFRKFSPGRRLHNKVLVADGKLGIVGGINIADKYHDTAKGKGWLDFALRVEGSICEELQMVCIRLWGKEGLRYRAKLKVLSTGYSYRYKVRIRENDFFGKKEKVSKSYKQSVRFARNYLIIVGAYFLPGWNYRQMLKRAAQKGIRIKLILASRSDVGLTLYAQRHLYAWLLDQGIEIYEWNGPMVHGKVALADDIWFTIGSYNLNYLSDFSNLELNLEVLDAGMAKEFRKTLETIICTECKRVTSEDLKHTRNVFVRSVRWIAYNLLKFSMVLTAYLTSKPKK